MAFKGNNFSECCICFEEFTDPRVLPCYHTFCLKCLKKMGQEKRPGDNMACPFCRIEFKIPETGFEGIQKNLLLEKLKSLQKLSSSATNEIICESCNEDGEMCTPIIAVMYCIECGQKICEECCKAHRRVKISKDHCLVDLKDENQIEMLTKKILQCFCHVHLNELIRVYCFGLQIASLCNLFARYTSVS